jgi:hypothetical protein
LVALVENDMMRFKNSFVVHFAPLPAISSDQLAACEARYCMINICM